MDYRFLVAPILAYLIAGSIKFALNSFKRRKLAVSDIGMGGMPSTHNSITSATFFTLVFCHGPGKPATGVALTIMIIVMIDSLDLRKKIESHARIVYQEFSETNHLAKNLRLSIGHSPMEVTSALILGGSVGWITSLFPNALC